MSLVSLGLKVFFEFCPEVSMTHHALENEECDPQKLKVRPHKLNVLFLRHCFKKSDGEGEFYFFNFIHMQMFHAVSFF